MSSSSAALSMPSLADWLNDLSFHPPASETRQGRKSEATGSPEPATGCLQYGRRTPGDVLKQRRGGPIQANQHITAICRWSQQDIGAGGKLAKGITQFRSAQ